jgi:hypothetical protein
MSSVVFSQKIVPSAIAALEAARKASVSVTVNCQCDGIVIDGHQFIPNPFVIDDGHGGRQPRPAGFFNGTPTHVPATILAALIEHAGELEPLLKAAGWWSCGCKGGAGVAS